MTVKFPGILFSLSTWMKVGMALQKLIIIRYPIKSMVLLSGKLVGITIFSLAFIGGVLNSFHMYRQEFKKAMVLNEETREVEYKCSITLSYIDQIKSEFLKIFVKISPLLFRSIGPMLLMILCCIGIIATLLKHRKKKNSNGLSKHYNKSLHTNSLGRCYVYNCLCCPDDSQGNWRHIICHNYDQCTCRCE